MSRAFKRGVVVGLLAPLGMLAGIAYWTYRNTQKVPFPIHRPEERELAICLVEPAEVPGLWAKLREDMRPYTDTLAGWLAEVYRATGQSKALQVGPIKIHANTTPKVFR